MVSKKSLSKSILAKSKNWISFKRTVDVLDNKTKGDAFEDLAQHFFQIDPKYRTKLKNVWNVNKREVPSRINRKLNLFSLDLGIDLLAETTEGEFWAIQCKYHSDQSKSLTKSEIDSCMNLAFGHCEGISLAVVCTSAEKYSRNLRGFAEEKLTYCDGSVWRSLDENFFKAVRKNLKGQSQSIKALKPRPHQKRAIKNALDHFVTKKNERGKMIMPCGSGKSLTGYWIANDFKAKKILVAVPSLALIKQTLEVWAEQSVANKKNVRWICVCSDKSVGNISNDDVAVQLQDLGIKIHTDPAEIASWLKKRSSATTVVFTTYHSGEAIAAASKRAKYSFDLGICDEAHKTVGAGGNTFSHLLYEKNIKVKRRLFMTATERRYGGSADKVISMDDHDLYGETFELLSFKEALECKPAILSDYKIITIGVTQREIRENIRKNILVRPSKGAWNEETEIQMLTAALALRKAIKLKGIKHAVSFHSSIARAMAFRETQDKLTQSMRGLGKLETFHVSAKVQTADREKILDEFAKSKRSLITNARCLTEGVDVKQIDCVVFADPKKSAVDIVQAVGRALRPFEGKKYGYVIVPQLIDAKSVKGRIEQNESFKDILMTLRALAANDERIVEYFRSVSEGKKIPKRITPIEFVTPVGTEIDYKQFEDDLKLKVWGRLAKLSWRPFEGAREFTRSLNFKIIYQWREYAKSKSKPEDIPACPNQIYLAKGWISFPDWLGYKSKNYIHNKTPFYTANKYALKSGIKTQLQWQKAYDRGELPEGLPKNPHQAYIDEGFTTWFDFLGTESPDDFMNKGLNLLKEYAKKNKHCNPYEEKVYKGFNLWYFVLNVRKSYKQNLIFESTGTYDPKKGRPLTDEEVARLNQITYWSWKSKGEQEWINAFEEILNIQKTNGLNFLKIPTDLRLSSGMKAQRWISRQRTNKRTGRGNLNDERISLLETKLEGWSWDPQEDISINNYKDIAQYFEKEKPESITQKLVYKGKKIGTTVSKVRQNYKANKLSGELIEKYNLLKNWTWDASGAIPSNRLIGSYNQARKKAIHFGLKTSLEYRAFIKELNSTMDSFQKRLPFNPADYYKDKGWKGWDHFLGKTK